MFRGMRAAVCILPALVGSVSAQPPPAGNPSAPIALFNGRDFDRLVFFTEDPAANPREQWVIENGVLRSTGVGRGYVRTDTPYADYSLEVEWRWPGEPGNSGVILNIVNGDKIWPKGVEAQLAATHSGDFFLFSDARSPQELLGKNPNGVSTGRLVRPGENPEKPAGEWNKYDIEVRGDTITLGVNGKEVNKMSNFTPTAGYIALQAEGSQVEFRNINLRLLPPLKDLNAPLPPGL